MQYPRIEMQCRHCSLEMPAIAFFNAPELAGFKLCHNCHDLLSKKRGSSTEHALALYFALKRKGIDAELEKSDGYKKVDIAIESVKLYIEVDGDHHYTDHNQAMRDLQRTFYSLQHDFITIRVPNALIENDLDQASNYLSDIVSFRMQKAG